LNRGKGERRGGGERGGRDAQDGEAGEKLSVRLSVQASTGRRRRRRRRRKSNGTTGTALEGKLLRSTNSSKLGAKYCSFLVHAIALLNPTSTDATFCTPFAFMLGVRAYCSSPLHLRTASPHATRYTICTSVPSFFACMRALLSTAEASLLR
jgi:hypothetical protein